MRIVHFSCNDVYGSRFNGHDMQIAFNKRGISCKQFVIDKYGDNPNTISLIRDADELYFRYLCMNYESEYSLNAMLYPYGWRFINHPDFINSDVVHYHCIHNHSLSLAMLPLLTSTKPTVYSFHDPWIFTGHCVHPIACDKWEKEKCEACPHLDRFFPMKEDNAGYMWGIKKEVFSDIDIDIVVASKWMLDLVRRSPITSHIKRVHHIPFGIDTDLFNNKTRDKTKIREGLGIDKDDIVLFFRSSDSLFKGLPYIQQMINRLKVSTPITLLTVGVKDLIQDGNYKVIDNGLVSDENLMADLYAASDIYLMPSVAESFGLMAVEAMSSGLPVIVSKGTALPEVTFTPECGILIENDDVEQFASTVTKLIENPTERHKRGELGRKVVLENYNVEDYYKKMLELYESVSKRELRDKSINNVSNHRLSQDIINFQMFTHLLSDISDKFMEIKHQQQAQQQPVEQPEPIMSPKVSKRRFFTRPIKRCIYITKRILVKIGLKSFLINSTLYKTLNSKGIIDRLR